MKVCISAESTIDLPKELLVRYNIRTTPFGINFNDKLVEDILIPTGTKNINDKIRKNNVDKFV